MTPFLRRRTPHSVPRMAPEGVSRGIVVVSEVFRPIPSAGTTKKLTPLLEKIRQNRIHQISHDMRASQSKALGANANHQRARVCTTLLLAVCLPMQARHTPLFVEKKVPGQPLQFGPFLETREKEGVPVQRSAAFKNHVGYERLAWNGSPCAACLPVPFERLSAFRRFFARDPSGCIEFL